MLLWSLRKDEMESEMGIVRLFTLWKNITWQTQE
jgi:hypothetical protein